MAVKRKSHLKKRKSSLRIARLHRTQRLKNLKRHKNKMSERRALHFFILENTKSS